MESLLVSSAVTSSPAPTNIYLLGFHAKSPTEFAKGFAKALDQSPSETLAMRKRARTSAKRFSEEVFRDSWNAQMDRLIQLRFTPKGERQKLHLD